MARVVDKRLGKGGEADARQWAGRVSRECRTVLFDEGEEKTREVVDEAGEDVTQVVKKGMAGRERRREKGIARSIAGLEQVVPATGHVALRQMLRWKVRYFTDGVAVGSRAFVDGFSSKAGSDSDRSARAVRAARRRARRSSYGARGI